MDIRLAVTQTYFIQLLIWIFKCACFNSFNWAFNLQFYALWKGREEIMKQVIRESPDKKRTTFRMMIRTHRLDLKDLKNFEYAQIYFDLNMPGMEDELLTWPTSGCGGRKLGWASLPDSSVTTTPGESRGRAGEGRGQFCIRVFVLLAVEMDYYRFSHFDGARADTKNSSQEVFQKCVKNIERC